MNPNVHVFSEVPVPLIWLNCNKQTCDLFCVGDAVPRKP